MFKIIIKAKFSRENVFAMPGDIIICNLSEGDKREFYVTDILPNGVIIGQYISDMAGIESSIVWPYGENYDRVCNAVPEH
jgi:hypothetical protein